MRHVDFAPLYRSTIGFDRLVNLFDASGFEAEGGYPPYNIERVAENDYRITMAVAGFSEEEINIEVKDTALLVTGEKKADGKEAEYLHRGIAARSFERRFQLADYVEVTGASLKDGLLNVELQRNLPERMKPRTIAITSANENKQIAN